MTNLQKIDKTFEDVGKAIRALSGADGSTSASYVNVTGTEINLSAGTIFYKELSENTSLTFTNLPASGKAVKITLILKNADTYTVTWPNNINWSQASAPNISTTYFYADFIILGDFVVGQLYGYNNR